RKRELELFGTFQFAFPRWRQVLAGAVDEELNHTDPRADALGTDLLAGHYPGDGFGVPGEETVWRKCGNRPHVSDPLLFSLGHDCLPWIAAPDPLLRKRPVAQRRTGLTPMAAHSLGLLCSSSSK